MSDRSRHDPMLAKPKKPAREAPIVHPHRDIQPPTAIPPVESLSPLKSFAHPPHTTPPLQSSDSNFPKGMSSRPPHWDWTPAVRRSFDPVSGATQACRAWEYCGQVLSVRASQSCGCELVSELNPKYPFGFQVLRSQSFQPPSIPASPSVRAAAGR